MIFNVNKSDPLSVKEGGTGATSASSALSALGGAPKNHTHDYTLIKREHVTTSTSSGTVNWYVEKWNGTIIKAVGVIDLVLNYSVSDKTDGSEWYHPTEGAYINIPSGFSNYVVTSTSLYVMNGSSGLMTSYACDLTSEGFTLWTWMKGSGSRTIKAFVEIDTLNTI